MSENEPRDNVVLEGEVVPRPASLPRQVLGTVQVAARHDYTKAVVRNAAYAGIGIYALGKRLWDSRTTARYERWMRGAEQSGDHESLLELERRLSSFRKDRHQRRKDWIELPIHVVMQLPKLALGFVAVLAVIGGLLAGATHNTAEIATPFIVLARVVEITVIVISVAWARCSWRCRGSRWLACGGSAGPTPARPRDGWRPRGRTTTRASSSRRTRSCWPCRTCGSRS